MKNVIDSVFRIGNTNFFDAKPERNVYYLPFLSYRKYLGIQRQKKKKHGNKKKKFMGIN